MGPVNPEIPCGWGLGLGKAREMQMNTSIQGNFKKWEQQFPGLSDALEEGNEEGAFKNLKL